MTWLRDTALCFWFVAVAAAFWAPLLLGLPIPGLTAVYGIYLLAAVAATVLRLLEFRREVRTGEGANGERR